MTRYATATLATAPSKICPVCQLRYDAAAVFCQKDGARLQADGEVDPLLGKVVLGQFRIEEPIGAGGMGTVYRAKQLNLNRDVAIKILHSELTENPDAVRRFHREARVATSLEHPNLVRVFLFGELEDDAGLYLVMEYLNGRSLTELMREEGALEPARAMHIAAQLCDAIGAAHAKGIVHRDIKPENIIVVSRHGDPDFVKVLDFGIARLLWDEQSHLTQSGVIFGTARYISPEGAMGEFTDARSDVYSTAVLLYQLLTGVTPFDAKSPVAMLMEHINNKAPDLRSRGVGDRVPQPIADVIMRALAKNPDARFDTATEFGAALAEAAAASGLTITRRFGAADSSAGVTAATFQTSGAYRTPTQDTTMGAVAGLGRRRWPAALLAFLIGAAVVVAVALGASEWSSSAASDELLASQMAAAEQAFEEGHFDREHGEGDGVDELTHAILVDHPGHEGARALRERASASLRARGDAAREAHEYDDAREHYRLALVFAPQDREIAELLRNVDDEEIEHEDPPGLRAVPDAARVGERINFLGIAPHDMQVESARFEVRNEAGRVLQTLQAAEASEHHYIGSYSFRTRGDYVIRFLMVGAIHDEDASHDSNHGGLRDDEGNLFFDVPVSIASRTGRITRPRVSSGSGSTTSGTMTSGSRTVTPTPTPPNVPAVDDGIDWTIPSEMGGAGTTMSSDTAPPPWTGSGSTVL